MSGSGVFDALGRLMGMVCQADPKRDTFFVMPFDSFREAARSLGLTFSVAPNDDKEALQALLELNFNAQVNYYVTVAADHPTPRAILIHGKPRHGHGVIAHRIVNSRLQGGGGEEPRVIALTFGRFDLPRVDIFYSELAEQIGIEPCIRRETILATLADMLRSDSIVLLVRTGAFTRGDVHAVSDLIDGFWRPLTQAVGSGPAKGSVLMIVLDEEGSRSSWAGLPMDSPSLVAKEHLVELPELDRICKADLRSWLVQRAPRLASALPVDVWVEAMWRNSQDGLPEALFHRVCMIFNQEWDMVKKWLLCA
jgi:inactive STAND